MIGSFSPLGKRKTSHRSGLSDIVAESEEKSKE
jgi:hypothetical protein